MSVLLWLRPLERVVLRMSFLFFVCNRLDETFDDFTPPPPNCLSRCYLPLWFVTPPKRCAAPHTHVRLPASDLLPPTHTLCLVSPPRGGWRRRYRSTLAFLGQVFSYPICCTRTLSALGLTEFLIRRPERWEPNPHFYFAAFEKSTK